MVALALYLYHTTVTDEQMQNRSFCRYHESILF